ncbi:hemerythrin domain-containing protein [Effusibacillus consociatus]|uniref:Hemerythrin domain-containing protein n=1 Tax=Effusibacillus consociatus TaxID=1117041 RepID=A0ABV9Q574_9BACL
MKPQKNEGVIGMFSNEGCMGHLAGAGIEKYCTAIQRLFDEHPPLRAKMEQLILKAKRVMKENEDGVASGIQELLEMESSFKEELEIHSDKEEKGLFPLVGRHIGTQFGPIAVMEYEHSEAKKNLAAFEELARNAQNEPTQEEAGRITAPLITAIHILLDHFLKEENVLFPMAENILTSDEKEELLGIIQAG